jgi:hypothetical protein
MEYVPLDRIWGSQAPACARPYMHMRVEPAHVLESSHRHEWIPTADAPWPFVLYHCFRTILHWFKVLGTTSGSKSFISSVSSILLQYIVQCLIKRKGCMGPKKDKNKSGMYSHFSRKLLSSVCDTLFVLMKTFETAKSCVVLTRRSWPFSFFFHLLRYFEGGFRAIILCEELRINDVILSIFFYFDFLIIILKMNRTKCFFPNLATFFFKSGPF